MKIKYKMEIIYIHSKETPIYKKKISNLKLIPADLGNSKVNLHLETILGQIKDSWDF